MCFTSIRTPLSQLSLTYTSSPPEKQTAVSHHPVTDGF